MKPANRFAQGSGVYQCRVCERKTRSTGRGDNENVRLCAECYEIAGIDNALNDEGRQATPNERAELENMLATIEKRGGNVKAVIAENEFCFPEALA